MGKEMMQLFDKPALNRFPLSFESQRRYDAVQTIIPALQMPHYYSKYVLGGLLFGSVAKGTSRPESDIDIALVTTTHFDRMFKVELDHQIDTVLTGTGLKVGSGPMNIHITSVPFYWYDNLPKAEPEYLRNITDTLRDIQEQGLVLFTTNVVGYRT